MADTPQNMQPESVIASIFGVSTRRIQQLKAEGIIKSVGRPAKYDLLPTIKAYIKYLADKAYGREQKQTDKELGTEKLKAETDALNTRTKADELENVRRASQILTEQIVAPLKAELDEVRGEVAFLRGAIDRIDGCTRIASCPVLAELRKRNANCN